MADMQAMNERLEALKNAFILGRPQPGTTAPGNAYVLRVEAPFRYRIDASISMTTIVTEELADVFAKILANAFRLSFRWNFGWGSALAKEQQLALPAPPKLSEAQFRHQARHEPDALLRALRDKTLSDANLSFAAEAAGEIENAEEAVSALVPLLGHKSAVVREGVVAGLAAHVERSDSAQQELRRVAADDLSAAVRLAARGALAGV